jgi:hypothetical protein
MLRQELSLIVLNKSIAFFTIAWCLASKRRAQQADRMPYLVDLERLCLQLLCFEEIFVQTCTKGLAIEELVAGSAAILTTHFAEASRDAAATRSCRAGGLNSKVLQVM